MEIQELIDSGLCTARNGRGPGGRNCRKLRCQ